jgi:hypothetical protein
MDRASRVGTIISSHFQRALLEGVEARFFIESSDGPTAWAAS